MNKYIALFLSIVLLTSCTSAPVENVSQAIDTPSYTAQVFPAWVEVPAKDIETTIPEADFRVYRSPEPIGGIYSKYTLIQEELLSETNSLSFAKKNIETTPSSTRNYTKIREAEITLNGERTLLHIFEAQNTGVSSSITFIQTYIVKNGTQGYTLSFSVSPTVQNYEPYIAMLQKFVLK